MAFSHRVSRGFHMSVSSNILMRSLPGLCVSFACLVVAPAAHALSITNAAIFSSNPEGQNYGGLIWNTVGRPTDPNDRWNLYLSSSTDINDPVFLNDENDARTAIDIQLTPGIHSFGMYGEAAGNHSDHFTLSLYFNGNASAPGISAAAPVNGGLTDFVVATHADGLGLITDPALNPIIVPNAATLSFIADGLLVTLTEYFWETDTSNHPDLVWSHNQRHHYGPSPYGADFYGQFTVAVTNVPEPASFLLLGIGMAGIGFTRRKQLTKER